MIDLKNFSEENIPYSKNSMAHWFVTAFVNSKKGLTYLKKDSYYENICKNLFVDWDKIDLDSKDLMKLALRIGRVNSKFIRKVLNELKFTSNDQIDSLIGILNKLNKLFNCKYHYKLNLNDEVIELT